MARRLKGSTVYRRGKRLWLAFIGPEGKRIYRNTGYLVGQELLAEEVLDRIERAIREERFSAVGALHTVEIWGRKWAAGRVAKGKATNAKLDEKALENHVFGAQLELSGRQLRFGDLKLDQVRVGHVRAFLEHLELKNIGTAEKPDHLAGRTRRSIYSLVNRLFKDAERTELIHRSPCQLERGEWPQAIDKDLTWRAGAVFTLAELERLVSDDRVPLDRRVFYAVAFLGGCREGEIAALRWSAYDADRAPLGALHVHASYTRKNKREKSPKNKLPREVPVHPITAALLAEWKLSGWRELFGRNPKPDNLLVPNRAGAYVTDLNVSDNFGRDLDALGLRHRRFHDTKRTFVTLARAGGAGAFLRWISHGPTKGEMQDTYASPPWETLCREVMAIKAQLRGEAVLLPLRAAAGGADQAPETPQLRSQLQTEVPHMEATDSTAQTAMPRARFELSRQPPPKGTRGEVTRPYDSTTAAPRPQKPPDRHQQLRPTGRLIPFRGGMRIDDEPSGPGGSR